MHPTQAEARRPLMAANPKCEAAVFNLEELSLVKPKYEAEKPKGEAAKHMYEFQKPKCEATV